MGSADGEPRLFARTSHHDSDSIELVPALRPQSAEVCAEYLLGQTRGLSEGDAARLSHAESGELYSVAGSSVEVKSHRVVIRQTSTPPGNRDTSPSLIETQLTRQFRKG